MPGFTPLTPHTRCPLYQHLLKQQRHRPVLLTDEVRSWNLQIRGNEINFVLKGRSGMRSCFLEPELRFQGGQVVVECVFCAVG